MTEIEKCPCCGFGEFTTSVVLWPELIEQWALSAGEAAYVNRQQGLRCGRCKCNLRSMTLAFAITSYLQFQGTLSQYVRRPLRQLRVLEINEAGDLTPFVSRLRYHTLARYPEVDIMRLPYADCSYDLVIHSDTLEHVPDPIGALRECRRVLRPSGGCAFTVPVITGRMTRSREGLPKSYHGNKSIVADDWAVCTEYGADAWTHVIRAGFLECRVACIEFPSSVALLGIR
jgi:SAM-dependent methyltransferase